MLTAGKVKELQNRAAGMLADAGIAITAEEREAIEVADLGLGEIETTGLELVVYVNNERYCAKELIMLPGQTCPEHRHPPREGDPGKTETFRCRSGVVYLYVPGEPTVNMKGRVPVGSEDYYTVFNEVALSPGDQYTIGPDTLHWFQPGGEGAIVSEFSSPSDDESDIFTDPRIKRTTEVE